MPEKQSDVWNDPFDGKGEDEEPQAMTASEPVEESFFEPAPDNKAVKRSASSSAKALSGKKTWLTPRNIVIGTVLILVLATGSGFLWKKLSAPDDSRLLLPTVNTQINRSVGVHSSAPRSAIFTRTNSTPPPVQDGLLSSTADQSLTSSVGIPVAEQATPMTAEIELLREALEDARSEAQAVAATLRGEGMATISKTDLGELMQANSTLQKQVDAAIITIKQAKEEKEQAFKQVSEIEARYRNLTEQANKQVTQQKAPSQKTPPQKTAPTVRQTRLTSESQKTQETKQLPFAVIGMTDSFIVVKQGTAFTTMEIGQALDDTFGETVRSLFN